MFKGMCTWAKILFIISLAFNLIIIGSAVGHHFGFWRGGHHHGFHKHILKLMPIEKRPQVEKILSDYKKAYPRQRGRMLKNWEGIETQLRQDQFNREEFLKTLRTEIDQHDKRWVEGGKAIADIAELLTASERAVILDKINAKMERWKKHAGRHKKWGRH